MCHIRVWQRSHKIEGDKFQHLDLVWSGFRGGTQIGWISGETRLQFQSSVCQRWSKNQFGIFLTIILSIYLRYFLSTRSRLLKVEKSIRYSFNLSSSVVYTFNCLIKTVGVSQCACRSDLSLSPPLRTFAGKSTNFSGRSQRTFSCGFLRYQVHCRLLCAHESVVFGVHFSKVVCTQPNLFIQHFKNVVFNAKI